MGIIWRNTVEEPAEGLVAPAPVTQARPGGLDAGGNILCTKLLAQVVNVTGLGRIQATVHCRHADFRVC